MDPQPSTLSSRGWQTAAWVLLASFQYGWHISALNQIQAVLTCHSNHLTYVSPFFPPCIPMNTLSFSIVTSSFTVGGLLGSVAANHSMESFGRKSSIRINALLILLGSSFMSVSASVTLLAVGRLMIGIGSGLGLCVVPAYLSEIAPSTIKDSIGVLNQLAIVTGILITQSLGVIFAFPSLWRLVPAIATVLALTQLLLSFLAIDSPAWLSNKSRTQEAIFAASQLWSNQSLAPVARASEDIAPEEEGLLLQSSDRNPSSAVQMPPKIHQLLRPPLLRPLLIVSLSMIAPQVSGINAVFYYSNDILSRAIPHSAAYVSLSVAVINVLMTFPPIYFIKRIGHRSLMTLSTVGALISLVGIGYGLNGGYTILASTAVLTFVSSFAIGLGPVPFVIIPDVSPFHVVSSLSSIALSLNWATNFLVGISFLPLRDLLSRGDAHRQGYIFYVFAVILLVVHLGWSRAYNGR